MHITSKKTFIKLLFQFVNKFPIIFINTVNTYTYIYIELYLDGRLINS